MADDKQWTDEDWQLWKRKMYLQPLARAQATNFEKEFRRWHTRHLLDSLTHHFSPVNHQQNEK